MRSAGRTTRRPQPAAHSLENIAAFKPEKLVPGRRRGADEPCAVQAGLDGTRAFLTAMFESVKRGAAEGKDLRTVDRETCAQLKPKFGH